MGPPPEWAASALPLDPDAPRGGRVGVAPTSPQYDAVRVAHVPSDSTQDHVDDVPDDVGDVIGDAQEAIESARQRLAEVPAEVVVTNHVMGLYELAAIHLSSPTPNLPSAALAIDAVAFLVDGLGDRIGESAPTMRDALANIRMAFVQVKAATTSAAAPPAAAPADPDE
jgi:hypothetical protein